MWELVKEGLVWRVCNGEIVNFWNDAWISSLGPLKRFFTSGNFLDETIRVCDVVDESKNWNQ